MSGVIRYKCTVCKREKELPRNTKSVETIQRCTITQGCRGEMYQVAVLQDFVRGRTTPDAEGLDNWQQRKMLYNHTQKIPSNQWIINHGLGTIPNISTFVDLPDGTQEEIVPSDIVNLNQDQTVVNFDINHTGIAQAVARSTNPSILQTTNVKQVQATSKQLSVNGEIVLAIRRSIGTTTSQTITLSVLFNVNNRQEFFEYQAFPTPTVQTAWGGVSTVSIRGKPYIVYGFNMLESTAFDLIIENGSTFNFLSYSVNLQDPKPLLGGDCIILLSDFPFDAPDRIVDKYIDSTGTKINNVDGLVFNNREFYANPAIIRSIYPYIKI